MVALALLLTHQLAADHDRLKARREFYGILKTEIPVGEYLPLLPLLKASAKGTTKYMRQLFSAPTMDRKRDKHNVQRHEQSPS
jgi:hypothetical protein